MAFPLWLSACLAVGVGTGVVAGALGCDGDVSARAAIVGTLVAVAGYGLLYGQRERRGEG